MSARAPLGWLGIARLGLVQASIGAVVVLTTSTLNRVMVVELALPAMLPGALVGLHYMVQILRPRMGWGSDVGGRRTPWIVGGVAVLGAGGVTAAIATAWMETQPGAGIALAVAAFVLIGGGVAAAGTTLLVLLAKLVAPERRAAAATITWLMMIAGFALTAGVAGYFLDPFSLARLVAVTAGVAGVSLLVTTLAVYRLEGAGGRRSAKTAPAVPVASVAGAPVAETISAAADSGGGAAAAPAATGRAALARTPVPPTPAVTGATRFRDALAQVWREPHTRRFTTFVFVSMLAYSSQDLILEPFTGTVFGLTPGESTRLAGAQHAGMLAGMLAVAILGTLLGRRRPDFLRRWTIGGCIASALALCGIAAAGYVGPAWPLGPSLFALGAANGAFAVAAIGSMMTLVGRGRETREGVRMGLWGAAQAVAFGIGGFLGTAAIDLTRALFASPVPAYASVFLAEAVLFLIAAICAARIDDTRAPASGDDASTTTDAYALGMAQR